MWGGGIPQVPWISILRNCSWFHKADSSVRFCLSSDRSTASHCSPSTFFWPSTTCLFCSLMNNLSTLLYTSASLMIFSTWEMKIFVCYILSSDYLSLCCCCCTLTTICLAMSFSLSTSDITSYVHSVDIINCDWKSKVMKPHLTSLNVGHPMFIVKCGAASNLEPVSGPFQECCDLIGRDIIWYLFPCHFLN